MSNSADIRDIQVLGDLKAAFGRFSEELQQILPALQKQFEEIQDQLDERQKHWRHQSEEAKNALYAARQELSECQSQSDDDEGNSPNCSFEEGQVSDAERAWAENEDNLETVEQWRHRIEGLIVDFQNDIHRLSNLASSRTNSAQIFLATKIEILNNYIGGSSSSTGISCLPRQSGNDRIASPDVWEKAYGYQLLFVAVISGKSRQTHRRTANKLLADKLESDAIWAAAFNERFGINVLEYMKSGRNLLNPPNVVWHHDVRFPTMIQLIRKAEHTDPILQDLLHPDGVGGYVINFSKHHGERKN